jgi:hypothetical protein
LLVGAAMIVSVQAAAAAEPLRPLRVATPPVIDGNLDEPVWQQAPKVTGFKTWRPDYGFDPTDPTVAWYAYDAENLYFAFRCFDREPTKIKASMTNRDGTIADDWICINLDSFNDQQALYAFYVNPLGVQRDTRFAANREDDGFDAVWYSAGRIDDQGYTIEMRVPFKSIRYRGGKVVAMGIIFERHTSRRAEGIMYPPMDPKAGMNFLIQMAPIEVSDIKHYTLFEALPDVTYSRHDVTSAGRLARLSSGGDVGVTAKYGLTAQLTLDGTVNPDFSQVEADAGQIDVNLRAPLFFTEKRPFFLEGQDVFNLGGPSQSGPLASVVHTRNIVNPLAGAKVSGKLSQADTLASIYALDELPAAPLGVARDDYAHFSLLRYKRSLSQDSYLGGFYTGREEGGLFNRVAGADGTLRVSRSSAFGFYALGSSTRGDVGTSAEAGHAVGASFSRDSRNLALSFTGIDISEAFAADSGYLARNGVGTLQASATPRFYPGGIVRRVDVTGSVSRTRDAFSGLWEENTAGQVRLTLQRAATVAVTLRRSSEVFLDEEFGTSGVTASGNVQVTKQLRMQGSFSYGDAIFYSADPFGGRSTRGSFTIVYQPSEKWNESLSLTYYSFDRAADGRRLYDYGIARSRTSYQVNRFLFFRGILEFNSFRRQLLTDLLASFTYIPGTVIHAGYGSLYEKTRWDGLDYVRDRSFLETRRGLFFKASYLWRL